MVASKDTPATQASLPVITDQAVLEQVMINKLNTRIYPRGELAFPCVPALLDHYLQRLKVLFETLGKAFSPAELDQLRQVLGRRLEEGFHASPHSSVILKYEPAKPPDVGLSCNLTTAVSSVADQYKNWVETRKPPLFGTHPDAKVMAVASELGLEPSKTPILDVGAGTGRNTLPLARLGYLVHAIELTPAFVQQIEGAANAEGLPIVVTPGNILDPMVRMKPAHYQLAVVSEVTSHFRDADQLRLLVAKMCDVLRSGGLLLFNLFVTVNEYEPERVVTEMSEMAWSRIFTPKDLQSAMEGLPLEVISNESVIEYEQKHLPLEAWPPTGWFVNWSTGRDLFPIINGQPPMELRWILCKRL